MNAWEIGDIRRLSKLLDLPDESLPSAPNRAVQVCAEHLKSALITSGFTNNETSWLEALDQFESVYYHSIFKDNKLLHEYFFELAKHILNDGYQLDILEGKCNYRAMEFKVNPSLNTLTTALTAAEPTEHRRDVLAKALKLYGIDLSPDTILALARREFRRKKGGVLTGRPEKYSVEELKSMALLPGGENRMKRTNARQALRRRGVPREEIPRLRNSYDDDFSI